MPVLIPLLTGVLGSGLGYLKGKYDIFSGVLKAPSVSPVQSVFSSPFMLGLTVVLGLLGLTYFNKISAFVKGAFK